MIGHLFMVMRRDDTRQLCGLHALNNLIDTSQALSLTVPRSMIERNTLPRNLTFFTVEDMNDAIRSISLKYEYIYRPDLDNDNPDAPELPKHYPGYNDTLSRKAQFKAYIAHAVGVKDTGPVSPRVLRHMAQSRGLVLRTLAKPLAYGGNKKDDEGKSFKFVSLHKRKEFRKLMSVEDLDLLLRCKMNLIFMCYTFDKDTYVVNNDISHYVCCNGHGFLADNEIDKHATQANGKLTNVRLPFSLTNLIKVGVSHFNPDKHAFGFTAFELVNARSITARVKQFKTSHAEELLHHYQVPGCYTKASRKREVMSIAEQNLHWDQHLIHFDDFLEKPLQPKNSSLKRKADSGEEEELSYDETEYPYFHPEKDDVFMIPFYYHARTSSL